MKTKFRIIFALLVALLVGVTVGPAIGCTPLIPAAVSFLGAFIPSIPAGALGAGVQVEIWEKDIEGQLFQDAPFLNCVYNGDQYVLMGKVVYIPQSGNPSGVVKNRANLPASVTKRTDSTVTYALDEFTTDPRLIPNADTVELSYDKRDSVTGEDKKALSDVVAEEALYVWADGLPAAAVVKTTGKKAVLASAELATGNRASATRSDLQTMRTLLVKQRKWSEGNMYALIPSSMLAQMFPADDVVTATYAQNLTEQERRQGVVYKAYGWNIMERGTVLRYDVDGVLRAQGALGAATDNEGAMFWEKNSLERALGEIKMFQDEGNPLYFGDIYSFLVRFGGRRRRADNKGVAVLVQGPEVIENAGQGGDGQA
ncbi:MAG: hypothetical protein LBU42_04335 [Prevotellaceae bacterium]|jgi:hypothetical protein|nr:hypothetical protein [Prevotellaceae bacterium]